jgi:DNA-binding GntR family transcriptional regulator
MMGDITTGRSAIKRNLLRDEIREEIQQAIINKQLKPGDRIVETQWASQLGVSKAPVREAIRELEAIGLLENRPYQGSFVRIMSAKQIEDANKVRTVLEIQGIKEATPIITPEQLDEIRKILDIMEQAASVKDMELYLKSNIDFHRQIMIASGNKTLLNVWHQANISAWTSIITNLSEESLVNLARRHEEMFEALKTRDVEWAVRTVMHHHKDLFDEAKDKDKLN